LPITDVYLPVCCALAKLQTDLTACSLLGRSAPELQSPPAAPQRKKIRTSLFGHYMSTGHQDSADTTQQLERKLHSYIDTINSSTFSASITPLSTIVHKPEFAFILPLFERVLCTLASSAPVERVFSQSGLLVRPHRARMSDKLLESLVFLKCN